MIPELKFDDLKPASSVPAAAASDLTKRSAAAVTAPVRVKSIFWLWLVNLLVLAALAGGLYYLYQGQQMSSQEVQGVYRRVDVMERGFSDLDVRIKAGADTLKGLEDRLASGDTMNQDAVKRMEGLEKRVEEVKAALEGVRRTAEAAVQAASRPAPAPVAATADISPVPAEDAGTPVELGTIPVEK